MDVAMAVGADRAADGIRVETFDAKLMDAGRAPLGKFQRRAGKVAGARSDRAYVC